MTLQTQPLELHQPPEYRALTPDLLQAQLDRLVAACGPGVHQHFVAIAGTERNEQGVLVPYRWKRLLLVHMRDRNRTHIWCDVDLEYDTTQIKVWYSWHDEDAWCEQMVVTLSGNQVVDVSETPVPLYDNDRHSARFLEAMMARLGVDPAPFCAHIGALAST